MQKINCLYCFGPVHSNDTVTLCSVCWEDRIAVRTLRKALSDRASFEAMGKWLAAQDGCVSYKDSGIQNHRRVLCRLIHGDPEPSCRPIATCKRRDCGLCLKWSKPMVVVNPKRREATAAHKACSMDGCREPRYCKSLCLRHYRNQGLYRY